MSAPLNTPDYDPLVTLPALYREMTAKGYSARTIARLVPIDVERISDLISKDYRRQPEPWLWEAYMLTRVLGCDGICTILGVPDLSAFDLTEDARGDLNIWRTGCDLPLSTAIRLTKRFGLTDPYDLYELIRLRSRNPIVTGLWNMAPTAGGCACPVGDAGHLPDCLPNLLWGPRDADVVATIVSAPRPRDPGKRQQGGGKIAPGLKQLRASLGVTQQHMADNIGCSLAHYCKIENLNATLTPENAQVLSRKFGWTAVDLFTAPSYAPDNLAETGAA